MPKSLTDLNDEDIEILKNIKVIFSDIDGTLTEKGYFSGKLFTAIENIKNQGINFFLITGRSAGWASSIAEYLPADGIIGENGAVLFRKTNGKLSCEYLIDLPVDIGNHRTRLMEVFLSCHEKIPRISETMDNRFRIADFTIELGDLSESEINIIKKITEDFGFCFTYSNVHIHIMPEGLNKAEGIKKSWNKIFSEPFDTKIILTAGDSMNDEAMFNSNVFSNSIGVSNIKKYLDKMQYKPQYICTKEEINGIIELIPFLEKPGQM